MKKFTLVELIVVVVAIAIISFFAIPNLTGLSKDAKKAQGKENVRAVQVAYDHAVTKGVMDFKNIEEGNPMKLDLNELEKAKKIHKKIKGDGEFWVDHNGTVWYSEVKLPNSFKNNTESGDVTFYAPTGVKECTIYENSSIVETIKVEGGSQVNYQGEPNKNYLVSCIDSNGNSTPPINQNLKDPDKNNVYDDKYTYGSVKSDRIEVKAYHLANGNYTVGEKITSTMEVVSKVDEKSEIHFGYTIVGPDDREYDADLVTESFKSGEMKNISTTIVLPEGAKEGFYSVIMTAKDHTGELARYSSSKSLFIHSNKNKWNYFEENDWVSMERGVISQISSLHRKNVGYDGRKVSITSPANTYEGGQARTREIFGHGSFEARMKLPKAGNKLSGFFLYSAKEGEAEADIEFFKEGKDWLLLFTIHNQEHPDYKANNGLEPGEIFQKKVKLKFDPTKDFHNYRINLYGNHVSVDVDGKEVGRWNSNFVFEDVFVFLSTFHPHWLDRAKSTEDQTLEVEWVRKGYFQQQ